MRVKFSGAESVVERKGGKHTNLQNNNQRREKAQRRLAIGRAPENRRTCRLKYEEPQLYI
jgi:hypothetical protein